MGKLPVIIAAVGVLWVLPASAGQLGAQAASQTFDTQRSGQDRDPASRDSRDRDRIYGYDSRHRERADRHHRSRGRVSGYEGDLQAPRAEGVCHTVTVRERRGNDVVVRQKRICD
jgi:hypothetical protein